VLSHLMPMLHLGAMAFAAALAVSGFMIAAAVGDIPDYLMIFLKAAL